DCFRISFGWSLVKETALFGLKTGMPNLIGVVSGLVMLYECLLFIPQYTTFSTLSGLASGIAGFINYGAGTPTALISESYLNGKKNLTQYYIAQSFRYAMLFQCLFLPTILSILMVLDRFFIYFNMLNYLLAIPFIIPWVVRHFQQPYTSLADNIQLGTNHPNFLMFIRFLEEVLKIFFMTLWIVWLKLPANYGLSALVWILPCGIYIPIMTKTISAYIFIHRRIVKIKVGTWQTLVAPIISGGIMFALEYFTIIYISEPLQESVGFPIAIAITLIILFVFIIFLYLPLTSLFGAWDDDSMRDFKHAAKMSGPSKFFVIPMYRLCELASKHSKLHNRYPIDASVAIKEARELLEIKNAHQKLFKTG
ncbi:MAG: hypothetical protein ACTSXP_13910, partial [Promethearchaeota archaeon]